MNPNFCSGCGGVWGFGCSCQVPSCNYTVINQSNPVSGITTCANVNIAGVGVLDAVDAGTAYFRGIESGSGAVLSVVLNATNHTIVLTLDETALAAALPQATTTQKGVGETATDAEAQAKASIVNFVTPSNFAAMGASTTFAGFIEIATNAEAIAGVSTTLAITPANLAATIAANYGTTVTFADAVTRAAAVPTFEGQYGYQLDTNQPYVAFGVGAGNWGPTLALYAGPSNSLHSNTTLTLLGNDLSFVGSGVGSQTIFFTDTTLNFGSTTFIELNQGTINFDGVTIQAGGFGLVNSLLGGDGSGFANAYLVSDFASLNSVVTGFIGFTNSAVRKVCDCNTVTLPQLAQIVDTLINLLKVPQLPHT